MIYQHCDKALSTSSHPFLGNVYEIASDLLVRQHQQPCTTNCPTAQLTTTDCVQSHSENNIKENTHTGKGAGDMGKGVMKGVVQY